MKKIRDLKDPHEIERFVCGEWVHYQTMIDYDNAVLEALSLAMRAPKYGKLRARKWRVTHGGKVCLILASIFIGNDKTASGARVLWGPDV